MSSKQKLSRADKARQLFKSGIRPINTGAHTWEILGSRGELYEIEELTSGSFNCSCPDMTWRGHGGIGRENDGGRLCKHIELVLMCREFDNMVASDVAVIA